MKFDLRKKYFQTAEDRMLMTEPKYIHICWYNQATRSKCRYFLNLVLDTALQNKLASLVDAIASSKVLKLSLTDPLTGDAIGIFK